MDPFLPLCRCQAGDFLTPLIINPDQVLAFLSGIEHGTILERPSSCIRTNIKPVFSEVLEFQYIPDLEELFSRDEAIFHASLSIASVYYDTGANNLFHCQQTLNIVSRRLSDTILQTKDETIGAVGLLVIHNVCICLKLGKRCWH